MVRRYGIRLLVWLLLVSGQAQAGDYRLWLEADEATLAAELGRPATVLLWYRGPADLDGIDTAAWEQDFAVDRGYAQHQDQDQRLRLRLTPRRTGSLTLPSLQLGATTLAPRRVQVSPAREGGALLEPRWNLTPKHAWQRQELRATLVLDLTDPQAHPEPGEWHPAGFEVTALPVGQQVLPDGGRHLRFAWLLRPLAAGTLSPTPPVLRYVRDGVPRRRFHFPVDTVEAAPLPPYVPPSVPVGRLIADPAPGGALHAEGIAADALASGLRRAGLPATTQQRRDATHGTRSEARIDWELARPTDVGVAYFDVASGRLNTVHPLPPTPLWQHPAWLVAAAALFLLAWRRRALVHRLRCGAYRRRLRARLRHAAAPGDLANALLAFPLPDASLPPRTLRAWLAAYRNLFGPPPERFDALAGAVTAIDGARYGGMAADCDVLRRLPELV